MALIKCPECGKEISDKAASCPNCGCPIAVPKANHTVRIKLPNNVADGWAALFSSKDSSVIINGKTVWKGLLGQNASFEIEEPTKVTVYIGSMGNPIEGTVEPGKKYSCVQDMGIHWKATYRLTEVDVIDAD